MAKKKEPVEADDSDILELPVLEIDGETLGDQFRIESVLPKVKKLDHIKDVSLTSMALLEKENKDKELLDVSIANNGQLQKALSDPVLTDNLCQALKNERSSTHILNAALQELAEEAAYIKAWRVDNWTSKEDLSEATFRRVKMLQTLVETISERERLKNVKQVGKIDFYGENFLNVFKFFLETIKSTFKKVNIPVQYEDIFFSQLAKEFDGFEKKAEKIFYGRKK